jgi:hypothetical protein
MGEITIYTSLQLENLTMNHKKDLDIDGRITLKWTLKKLDVSVYWILWFTSEHSNEPLGSIIGREVFKKLSIIPSLLHCVCASLVFYETGVQFCRDILDKIKWEVPNWKHLNKNLTLKICVFAVVDSVF